MKKSPNPFTPIGGWSYDAWEAGYASTTGVNPWLPENEALGESWQLGYETSLHDKGESLGRDKREKELRDKYFDDLYWP